MNQTIAARGHELAETGDAVERLASWVRRVTPRAGFSSATLSVLSLLHREGAQRVTDLVHRENVTQPGVTGIVTRLAGAGLVRREADPADRRAVRVEPTPAGIAFIEQLHQARADLIARHVALLSPAHQDALYSAVDALRALAAQPIDLTTDFPEDTTS
jgi:DNA-binding MarR family transcriptional regulator